MSPSLGRNETYKPSKPYLNRGCLSQQQVIKNSGIISIQVHQLLMGASFCDTALSHEDHFITINEVLETRARTTRNC